MEDYRVRQTGDEIQQILDQVPQNTNAISAEIERATAAEHTLDDDILTEKTRAEAAEQALQTSISGEASARQRADQDLDAKIEAETTRAENAERSIRSNKQDVIDDLATIRTGAAAGATAYQKPSAGIPKTDLAQAVQTSLGKADTALQQHQSLANYYTKAEVDASQQTQNGNIQANATAISNEKSRAEAAELALSNGKQNVISDLSTIRTGAAAGATAYQKPSAGIPKTDLAQAVQTSLGKADTALQQHQSLAGYYTKAEVDASQQTQDENIQANTDAIVQLQEIVADIETIAEGYVRVAGSSSPALSYKSYKYHEQGGFGRESVFSLLYPCLVGTKLTGDDDQVGKILHVLQKLDYNHDIYGNTRAIDGSEGDVQIVNIEPYFRIMGKHTIEGTEYDVFLVSRTPFTWQGIEAEEVEKFGWSPDFCVAHQDTDNVVRMHSVYNPDWNGSYAAPVGLVGKYIVTQDEDTGDIIETYDSSATLLGGAGGCHSTDINLPTGEQYAMNQNPDTTKTVPYMNHTAAGLNSMMALMLAEGGTFDAHNASLMGSGFSANDGATAAGDWEPSGSAAKNGMRFWNKNDQVQYKNFGWLTANSNAAFKLNIQSVANMINSWRNPFHVMEAHRAVAYAIQNGVHELEWFAFEGSKYKWRSISGFAGPAQGEMTCVVWKMLSAQFTSAAKDPSDGTTSLEGKRADFLVSVALFHGITTQVSPSWWTSGLIFTQNDTQQYEAYIELDQEELVKTPDGEIAASSSFAFEGKYQHVGTFTAGEGYAKNYHNQALMLPDSNANKTGAALHTYVGKYNWFTGGAASSGKKLVRGFRRGASATGTLLSPLSMYAYSAPSSSNSLIGFGTCCRIR